MAIADLFRMMARYNCWANSRVHKAAGDLSDHDYKADLGAYFSSIHGTLNHLLVADRIWLQRLTGEGEAPDRLDAILFEDRDALITARALEDERFIAFVDALGPEDHGRVIHYVTMTNPAPVAQPVGSALAHVFNHQTHHRGQIHAMLTRLDGRDRAPALDLILFQRETGTGLI